jgi:hypothetical protein
MMFTVPFSHDSMVQRGGEGKRAKTAHSQGIAE